MVDLMNKLMLQRLKQLEERTEEESITIYFQTIGHDKEPIGELEHFVTIKNGIRTYGDIANV